MSVSKLPSGKWRARVRISPTKEIARHFGRKVDAERWERNQKADLDRGQWVDPKLARRLFGDYVKEWQRHQVHHRATTTTALASKMKVHVLPTFEDRPLGAITRSEVQAWVASLSAELAPAMVERVYRLLAQVLRAAVDDGQIVSSPCRGIRLPERVSEEVVPPTVEQVAAVAAAMPTEWQACVWLSASSGMRRGEVLGLTVDRVDFLGRAVKVDRQLQGGELVTPKTKASTRVIPLATTTVELLSAHVAATGHRDGLLFRGRNGEPVLGQRFNEAWRAATTKAGVALRFHDLRHFYASLLVASGASVKVVQARLGHQRATETLDVYGHLWPDEEDSTRAAVEAVLAPIADYSRTRAAGEG